MSFTTCLPFLVFNQVQEIPLKKAGGKLLSSIPVAQRVLDILHDGSVFFNRNYFGFYVLDFEIIEHLNQNLQESPFRACLFLSCVPGPVTGEWWVLHHALTHGGKFSAAASAARWLLVTRLTSAELTSDLSTTHHPVLRPSPTRQHGPWTLGRGCRPQIWRTEVKRLVNTQLSGPWVNLTRTEETFYLRSGFSRFSSKSNY